MKVNILFIFLYMLLSLMSKAQITTEEINHKLYDVNFNELNAVQLDELELQANIYYLTGDYPNAASKYLEIIDLNIDDANAYYRLACCYAHLKHAEYAGNFLVMAINAGFNNFSQIQNEECFKNLRNNSLFDKVLKDVTSYGKVFGETIYLDANVLLETLVLLPQNMDLSKHYTLIVGLHGYGDNIKNFSFLNEYIESDKYIVVLPEAPYLKHGSTSRNPGYSWGIDIKNEELWNKSDPAVIKYILNVVDNINKKYNVEKKYILGFSQGAAYAYAAGIKNSDQIDAIIACGGRLIDSKKYPWFISSKDLVKGTNTKICIIHGKQDEVVEYKNALQAKRTLSKYDYKIKLLPFEGGHVVDKETLRFALEWLDKNK